MQLFKIRCSDIGKIMGGAITKPTEKQLQRMKELQCKKSTNNITQKQIIELEQLIEKRDSKPNLQAGAKTYCEAWLKEQLYGRTKTFSSKYTEKGIECEQQGIDLLAEMMGYGMVLKNTEWKQDEHITGTADVVLATHIDDVKCPYDFSTFPLFETELPNQDYYWQMQGYMAIYDKQTSAVNYCLIDAPEEMIDREARSVSFKAGFSEVEAELYDEVYRRMTYGDVDKELRFKRYPVSRNDEHIAAIRQQVELCREYIKGLSRF